MGDRQVFGVLLIGVALMTAYLWVTGSLGKVWEIITTGNAVTAAPVANDPGTTPAPQNTSSPTFQVPQNQPTVVAFAPVSTSEQLRNAVSTYEDMQSYSMPNSASVPTFGTVSNLSNVYSQTLARESNVTGTIS